MTPPGQGQQLNSDEEQYLQVRLEATEQHPGQYTLIFGSSRYSVTLKPERNVTLNEWLRRLRPVLVGENDPAWDRDPQDLLYNVGTWLWQALFPESAPVQESELLALALRSGHTPLLLALPDTLTGLPWELLCDPEQPLGKGFLAHRRPLMRLSDQTTEIAPIELPLRVLLLISSPPGLGENSRVDVESERAAVEQAVYEMRQAGFLYLLVEDIVTPKRVERLLQDFQPHVVHYIGHGEYDETLGGLLLWEDDEGNELPLSAESLANMLRPWNISAIVLHGCETGRRNARTQVHSLADKLVREGFSTVLAQQAKFTYQSSQLASHSWYTALTAGKSFIEALFEARKALVEADRPDWAVPMLQGNTTNLLPVFTTTSSPGSADSLMTRVGAAVDIPISGDIFVGRHRELRALHLMLEDTSDDAPTLAVITGPGGMGKSTLVAQAINRYGGTYKAALTLSCQDYQSIDLFLQSIGEFLTRLDTPGFLEYILPDPKLSTEAKINEAILVLNTVGPVLLIIDNLEDVQNEDQKINDQALLHLLRSLLTNLHSGRVLITGRFMVKEFLLPEKVSTGFLHIGLDDLSLYEASQLLLRHPPLASLSEIVRQMLVREFGGLPYIYNLLSSKAAAENLEHIIYEIREHGSLKQKTITQERKQHTSEEWQKIHREVVEFTALEIIVSRLPDASRTLLAQIGILHRPFPLAAIEEGLAVERAAWQPLLDWSLLHYNPDEKTYHLHSLTKHYAENLLEAQVRLQTQAQFATWYEHYAYHESHNLADYLEAHQLWRAAGNIHQAGDLVMELAETIRRMGLYPLLYDLCTITLHDVSKKDELLTAMALHELGNVAYLQGDFLGTLQFCEHSLKIFKQLGNQRGQAGVLYQLGNVAQDQGDYKKSHQLYKQSLKIEKRLGDQSGQANTLQQLGAIAALQGNYLKAQEFHKRSQKIFKQLSDQAGQARALFNLGLIAQGKKNYLEAQQFYEQSLEIEEQLGDQSGRAKSLHQLGNIALMQEEYWEAQQLYEQSLEIKERLGDQSGRAGTLFQLGTIAYLQENYSETPKFYRQSLKIFEQLGDQRAQAAAFYQLGALAYKKCDFEQALSYIMQAYLLFDSLHAPELHDAQSMLIRLRYHLDETIFAGRWQAIAGNRSLPLLQDEDTYLQLLITVMEFIKAPTWNESKRFLETHLELLQPRFDAVLKQLALEIDTDFQGFVTTEQDRDEARKSIEMHRLLLADCRNRGIGAAFAGLLDVQDSENIFAAQLSSICSEVVEILLTRNAEKKNILATHLEQMLLGNLPIVDAQKFLQVLIFLLRGQNTQALEKKLQPPFRDAYVLILTIVEQEEAENT